MNKNYQMDKIDETIRINDVVRFQPHILKSDLLVGIINYSTDDDSYEDFDSYTNRHN